MTRALDAIRTAGAVVLVVASLVPWALRELRRN